MSIPAGQSCDSCRFFQPKEVAGNCLRFPPVRVAPGQASYPTVTLASWCGEWSGTAVAQFAEAAELAQSLKADARLADFTNPPPASDIAKAPAKTKGRPQPAGPEAPLQEVP